MKSTFVRSWPLVALTTATLAATACSSGGSARAVQAGAALPRPAGTTSSSGLLAADHLFVRSALQVDMSNHTVRLPLHKGAFRGKTVWYIMTEASDSGIAHDLNINFSPKLANMGIGCKVCVQDVTLTGKPTNKFGEAIVNFAGVPDFSPTRKLSAGPMAFPPAAAAPGAVGDARYSPFIRITGSSVVYNAPIVAVGDAQFDVDHHTNTADRVMAIHQSKSAGPGQFFAPSVDILFVSGLEAGQKILYLSTEASDPMAATLERATFVPLLNNSSFVGGDDTLGSARERIFIFANGQTGASNPQAQGLAHLVLDGAASQDASLANTGVLDALRRDGDTLNVLGDFPSLSDPRHANAYSPLWDAQIGQWTAKAITEKRNTRQSDENAILNLAASRPDLLTGKGGMPFGSVGFIINCPTFAFVDKEPKVDLVQPMPGAQA